MNRVCHIIAANSIEHQWLLDLRSAPFFQNSQKIPEKEKGMKMKNLINSLMMKCNICLC